jgi:SAM-dependent methyltransferase
VEDGLWNLGAAYGKFIRGKLPDDAGFEDVVFSEEPQSYMVAARQYMLVANTFVVGSVLDLGCGDGLFLNCVWTMKPHVHDERPGKYYHPADGAHSAIMGPPFAFGVDKSTVAIRSAKTAMQNNSKVIAFEVGDITKINVGVPPNPSDDFVDTVTLLEVLEHLPIEQVQGVIDVALRLCRHRVVVTVPAREIPMTPNHVKPYFIEQELKSLFRKFVRSDLYMADDYRWLVVAHKRVIP